MPLDPTRPPSGGYALLTPGPDGRLLMDGAAVLDTPEAASAAARDLVAGRSPGAGPAPRSVTIMKVITTLDGRDA